MRRLFIKKIENHDPGGLKPPDFFDWDLKRTGSSQNLISPSAKRFKRWVTSEVLPAIRKHGVFVMDDIVNNTDALIEALQAFKAEHLQRMALGEENAVQKQQLVEIVLVNIFWTRFNKNYSLIS